VYIAHDADHRGERALLPEGVHSPTAHLPADGILAGPGLIGKGLAHHHDVGTVRSVPPVEQSAPDQLKARGVEEPSARQHIAADRVLGEVAVEVEASARHAGQRHGAHDTRVRDLGLGHQRGLELLVEAGVVGGLPVFDQAQIHVRGDHALDVHAGVHVEQGGEAADQQARAHQEHERQGHFRAHESGPHPAATAQGPSSGAGLERRCHVHTREPKRR
jgi:hypothetical protein